MNRNQLFNLIEALLINDLEKFEDFCLSELAEKLDKENIKIYTHEEAWN